MKEVLLLPIIISLFLGFFSGSSLKMEIKSQFFQNAVEEGKGQTIASGDFLKKASVKKNKIKKKTKIKKVKIKKAKKEKNSKKSSLVTNSSNFQYQNYYPKIASWLSHNKEIIESGKPYELVMTSFFMLEEAGLIKKKNPNAKVLAGISLSWVVGEKWWLDFVSKVSNYQKGSPLQITEDMYLRKPNGEKCSFGWASEKWNQGEIYAMDPRNEKWKEFITSYYKVVLDQEQHDGIIVDMVMENSWCPDAISDEEYLKATKNLFLELKKINKSNKIVIVNAGRKFSDVDEYKNYFDGFLMENFLGAQMKTDFEDGLKAPTDKKVIFAVDTENTGKTDFKKMRLGLAASLFRDNSFYTYDFGTRNHGESWWFQEFDINLGAPLSEYKKVGNYYQREFERAVVVANPNSDSSVSFDSDMEDASSGIKGKNFKIEKGDARIFLK